MKHTSTKVQLTVASFFALAATVTGALAASEYDGAKRGHHGGAHAIVKFVEMDVDNDNQISVREFLDARGKRFAAIDENDDNTITREEMRAHMEARREARGHERAGKGKRGGGRHAMHMFKRFDLDNNGEVTLEEYERQLTKRFALADRNDDQFMDVGEIAQSRGFFTSHHHHHRHRHGGAYHSD